MKIERISLHLKPEQNKVLLRPFQPSEQQIKNIISRVLSLSDAGVSKECERVKKEFSGRHRNVEDKFNKRFEQISVYLEGNLKLTNERKYLLGASLSMEYSVESTALFNPSIIWHPDQSGLPEGSKRFIISLRATGEGHISSIVFRSGIISTGNISIDSSGRFVSSPDRVEYIKNDKQVFSKKLTASGVPSALVNKLVEGLAQTLVPEDIEPYVNHRLSGTVDNKQWADKILSIARSEYEISYSGNEPLSERIIFPHSSAESNGIEDARFVQFRDDNGSITYYGTYTAYNGISIQPQLVETKDFIRFKIGKLFGPEIKNKGMAIFPRKVNGKYAMLSRQDAENNYIMFSDDIRFWSDKKLLTKPAFTWELVQSGNCGSPIETEKGWLVLTHGVGPVRKYCIGVMLLDLNDPSKVIGRLKDPLLCPNDEERNGYVPNVVYSCGSIIYNDELIIPYAMSDYASGFAKVKVKGSITRTNYEITSLCKSG